MTQTGKRITLALCALLGGCSAATDVDRQLSITLAVDRTIVDFGNPVAITVTVLNRGPREVHISDPRNYACAPPYSVVDERGQNIRLPGRLCLAIAYAPVALASGQSLIIRDGWAGNQDNGSLAPSPVASGRYHLAARVIGDDDVLTSEPVLLSVLTTATP
jgi:hypothetical protein